MTDSLVEFAGLCCHFDREDKGRLRTILVDGTGHAHSAHLDVQRGGITDPKGLKLIRNPVRQGIRFDVYDIKGFRVRVPSVDAAVTQQASYTNAVPQLTNVNPSFGKTKIQSFAQDKPLSTIKVAAQFDIDGGSLAATTLSKSLHFEPIHKDPPTKPGMDRSVATVVTLTLKLNNPPAIQLIPLNDPTKTISLGVDPLLPRIRIGNLTASGMEGLDDPNSENHFLLYYEMADNPADTPKPTKVVAPDKGVSGGCSNTQYP